MVSCAVKMSGLVRLKTVTDRQGVGTEVPTIADAGTRDKAWEQFVSDMVEFGKNLQEFFVSLDDRDRAVINKLLVEREKQGTSLKLNPNYSGPACKTEGTPGPSRVASLPVNTEMLTTRATSGLRSETPITQDTQEVIKHGSRKDDPGCQDADCWKSPSTSLQSETTYITSSARINSCSPMGRSYQDYQGSREVSECVSRMDNPGCFDDTRWKDGTLDMRRVENGADTSSVATRNLEFQRGRRASNKL